MYDNRQQIIAERGGFTIADGIINPLTGIYQVGQYIRIIGSVFNDGVYQIESILGDYVDVSLRDENYPQWVSPSGTIGLYHIGERVTHNGIRYVSLVNDNSWEPGTSDNLWKAVGEIEHSTRNETFNGAICPLAIPQDFLDLAYEISSFDERATKDKNRGVLVSESFGGYSYSMATNNAGVAATWKEVFSSRLNPYRRMFAPKI